MPYKTTSELPDRVRNAIPAEAGKRMFMRVVNAQMDRGTTESRAFASAWAALKQAGYKKNPDGKFIRSDGDQEKSGPTLSSVHVPSADDKLSTVKQDSYQPPESAKNNAQQVLDWKEEYGDEVNGMTEVGWRRARQLASGDPVSRDVVSRMAQFNRHRSNAEIDEEHKGKPWKDAGRVAWLGWGGDSGVDWAIRTMDKIQGDSVEKRQTGDHQFSTPQEARAQSYALQLNGAIHVHDTEDGAFYMPGATHEDYLERMRQDAGIEEEEDESDDKMERAIRTVMDSILSKSFTMHADVVKADKEQRIVYGWASIVSVEGKPLVDKQGHIISAVEMEKMANEFMASQRTAKAMHTGESVGQIIHSLPLTQELAKSIGMDTNVEGWLIGVKVHSDKVWSQIKDGTFKAFSIGGKGNFGMPEILSDIELDEISFVDDGANQGARIVMYKRNPSASDTKPKEAGMADKMTEEQKAKMKGYMDKGYEEDKAREMAMSKSASEVDGLLEEVDSLSKSNDDLSEKVMNMEMALSKAGITLKDDGTVEKAAEPEYIDIDGERVEKSAIPAPLLKRMEADRQRLADLEKRDRDATLAKRASSELPNLGGTDVQKGRLLAAIDQLEDKDALYKALKAADAAVSKMFSEVGEADAPDDSSADAQLKKRVSDYAAEKGITREAAFVQVTRQGEGRELLKRARVEKQ